MTVPKINTPQQLRDAYRQVVEQVGEAAGRAGRKSQDVVLVAVTKFASPDQIRLLAEMGHRDFGENRVQHLAQRVPQLEEFLSRKRLLSPVKEQDDVRPSRVTAGRRAPAEKRVAGDTIRWHMIGHLQRNKVKQVVPLVRLIHSVDSLRLAEELHALGARLDKPVEILLQVNSGGEESKYGFAPPAVVHVAEQIDSMIHLRLRGLMTMAPYRERAEDSRDCFARTEELFHDVRDQLSSDHFNILSMGMTNDYTVAIEQGANLVRVGRAIFGEPADHIEVEEEPDPQRVDRRAGSARIARENQRAREG
ncbi:MAG: YggS family pyridoxal phosphate-dependent enzyme [Phycisphaeraceae bacterium]